MNALLLSRPRKSISLTALIDVVFILLMFFMLTSSFSQWQQVDLALPASQPKTSVDRPQWATLTETGTLLDQERNASTAQTLAEKLNPEHNLVLMPAPNTPLQILVKALEQLQDAGFSQVTLGKQAAGNQTFNDQGNPFTEGTTQ